MLMLFDCILSAFLDNVIDDAFISTVITLCNSLKIDPRPLLLPLALFGNIGKCRATMIGDPPNIIVGNALKSTSILTISYESWLQASS